MTGEPERRIFFFDESVGANLGELNVGSTGKEHARVDPTERSIQPAVSFNNLDWSCLAGHGVADADDG